MKRILIAVASLLFCLSVNAKPVVADLISVDNADLRLLPITWQQAQLLVQITNLDSKSHRLIAANALVAEQTQLQPLPDERRNKNFSLKPGQAGQWFQLSLSGMRQKVFPGELVPVVLIFEDGSSARVMAKVSFA